MQSTGSTPARTARRASRTTSRGARRSTRSTSCPASRRWLAPPSKSRSDRREGHDGRQLVEDPPDRVEERIGSEEDAPGAHDPDPAEPPADQDEPEHAPRQRNRLVSALQDLGRRVGLDPRADRPLLLAVLLARVELAFPRRFLTEGCEPDSESVADSRDRGAHERQMDGVADEEREQREQRSERHEPAVAGPVLGGGDLALRLYAVAGELTWPRSPRKTRSITRLAAH